VSDADLNNIHEFGSCLQVNTPHLRCVT